VSWSTADMAWLSPSTIALLICASTVAGYSVIHDDGRCECPTVEIVAGRSDVREKHGALLGSYRLRAERVNNRPTYEHASGGFFLFYNAHSQGFWAVAERMHADVVRLENQGDGLCPYRLRSTWRFADGDLRALVYDDGLRVVCLSDACSVANCGHQAVCVEGKEDNGEAEDSPETNVGAAINATCVCEQGFYGDPYDRLG